MLRRFPLVALAGAVTLASLTPAEARTRVVYAKRITYLRAINNILIGLIPTHRYRVQVMSPKRRGFVVSGTQDYVYIANRYLRTRSITLAHKGTTPGSFTLTAPPLGRVSQWTLGMSVTLTGGRDISVKITDLGKR